MTRAPEVVSINIERAFPLCGADDSLESRLRKVTLIGFPAVKIFQRAHIEFVTLDPTDLRSSLHTPQPTVYRHPNLDRIAILQQLFLAQGVDLFQLTQAFDYTATDSQGCTTRWTLLPPVVESFCLPSHGGNVDYRALVGPALRSWMERHTTPLNPRAQACPHTSPNGSFILITDGSHRIHMGLEAERRMTVCRISGTTPGFPHPVVPKPYAATEYPTREDGLESPHEKTYIFEKPFHKLLYRLFPTGDIECGGVRPQKEMSS